MSSKDGFVYLSAKSISVVVTKVEATQGILVLGAQL